MRLDNIAGTPIVLNKVDLVFDGNLALKSQRISPVQVMFFLIHIWRVFQNAFHNIINEFVNITKMEFR